MGDPQDPRGLYTGSQAADRDPGAGARFCLRVGRRVSLSGCQQELDSDTRVVAGPGKEGEAEERSTHQEPGWHGAGGGL